MEGGTHVNPWLIHFNVRQNPLQYCEVISLQLIKKKIKKKKKENAGSLLAWLFHVIARLLWQDSLKK